MAPLSGIYIGKHARALAAALALGAAVLSLSPGQTAYAARAISTDAGDADTGAGNVGSGRARGSGTATRTIDPRARCTITSPGGHVDFYLPGTVYTRDGAQYLCNTKGQWVYYGSAGRTTAGGGGVATRTP